MHNHSIPETEPHHTHAAQSHVRDWRQRAARGWRLRAAWARIQSRYHSEWQAHADWCEQQARKFEAEA